MPSPHDFPSSFSSISALSALGWDATFAALFAEHAAAGLVPARIARVDRGLCDTLTAVGPVRADSSPLTGADREHTVCTGDWAALRPGAQPQVSALLPRRTAITRASSDRTSHQQVLAANVDTVVVAVSLAAPLNAGRIERLLALAFDSGARPIIVLTKADLAEHPGAGEAVAASLAPGVQVLTTSAATGAGLDLLSAAVSGTAVLLGPSGAGKSSLANALLGRDHMSINQVRAADGKGRHTTAHRELLALPGGGVLIDTPGLRGIGVQDVADGVGQVFAEIETYARDCTFRDCGHRSEPGCAVQRAIAAGELSLDRLDRYRKLLRESEWAATRGDARQASKRRKADKAMTRELRATYRFRGRQR
ncbi:ribosome small subunit-dependent GTPase A [Hoyosella subflava]|uniref:Small ribosomal subunit biogenesis GTPase RsgA n=1 Tax=Hoyosella subflava (strain DSM 45089 / JCM 17490 / NBRC 109087 / DQS3-9A1) TaxID=443218 RepID=F6EM66_HOYSD|nr:ribosome small subunit-dependent GTPase A [Hoyosella subflava]AEF39272.1 Ribosome small subunit-dependent GTPase A [Hoyosella subflava DQS3-9A1]